MGSQSKLKYKYYFAPATKLYYRLRKDGYTQVYHGEWLTCIPAYARYKPIPKELIEVPIEDVFLALL